MGKFSRIERFRLWLAGLFFEAAAKTHSYYDVWLDDAEPRHPSLCSRERGHGRTEPGSPCNGLPMSSCQIPGLYISDDGTEA